MATTTIIGAQWGDEGKGKIIDYLAEESDIVARFHGGNNAGHTIINSKGKFTLHLVPSGIFNPKTYNGIRLGDLMDSKLFSGKLSTQLLVKNKILKALGSDPLKQKEIENSFAKYRKRIGPYVFESFQLLN